jgi:hypothetical protein
MEATLVTVTLLSLAAAIGLAIVTWRLLQEAHQRADARVAALEEGLAASLAANPPAAARVATTAASTSTILRTAATEMTDYADGGAHLAPTSEIIELHSAGDPDWLAQFPPSATQVNGRSHTNGVHVNGTHMMHLAGVSRSNESDVPTQPIAALAAPASDVLASDVLASDAFAADWLFSEGDAAARVGAPARGVLAISVAGAVIVLLILALWSVGRLMAPGVDSRAAGGARGGAALSAANAAPLELVALEQTREGEALTIHGVVRNPPAGVMIDRLAVVVAFFDVSGQQLASVRAPLDFRTLAPGDESPFQVTTSVPTGVTRYRVSFRRDEGTIVPHVDRRQQEAS